VSVLDCARESSDRVAGERLELDIAGKTALISGSTRGIGRAIAHRLASEGARVIVTGRANVEAAVEALRREIPRAEVQGVTVDFADEADVRRLLDAVPTVDVLVNNVGIAPIGKLEDLTTADFIETFRLNVIAGAWLSQFHLPKMLARNAGRIIFISSDSAQQVLPHMLPYSISKAAQAALARGLAELCRGTEVTVNSILVGPTLAGGIPAYLDRLAHEAGASRADTARDFFRATRPHSLAQRFLTADEVADVAAFLASPRSQAMNGSAVRAEGGVLRNVF
jgi:NAD(P)-dependent dehydrogenase (short-subunit alcohol dehydrogenase family)